MLNHFKIELFLARETGFFQKDINNRNIFPRCRKKTREKRIKFKIFQNIISETCLRGNNNFRKLFNFLKRLTRVVEEQSGRKKWNVVDTIKTGKVQSVSFPKQITTFKFFILNLISLITYDKPSCQVLSTINRERKKYTKFQRFALMLKLPFDRVKSCKS